MSQAVLLVDGLLTGASLASVKLSLVILTEPNGDPVAINPLDVSRVESINSNRSRIRFISGGSQVVQGSVAAVLGQLTN